MTDTDHFPEDHLACLSFLIARGTGPNQITQAANQYNPEASRWAATQISLRNQARAKFSRADTMFFVREALEQATHERVAAYHASRFPSGVLVSDLTAGIGGDLIALAQRGPVIGFELDPERAQCARANLDAFGLSGDVVLGDGLGFASDYAWCDPARRSSGRRVRFEAYCPDAQAVAARFRGLAFAGLKLSPLDPDSFLEGLSGSVEFVSFGRECREAVAWFGGDSGRWAVHVESGLRIPASGDPEPTISPLRFLYQADPAAIRAHALGGFGLEGLGTVPGYLTSDEELSSPWWVGFKVLECLKYDVPVVRSFLRSQKLRLDAVKTRGVDLDPARVRKSIGRHDGAAAELVLIRTAERVLAIVVKRLGPVLGD